MKKAFLLGAMVCAFGFLSSCGMNNNDKEDNTAETRVQSSDTTDNVIIFEFNEKDVKQRRADAYRRAQEAGRRAGDMHK